jgi:hypothetical protein
MKLDLARGVVRSIIDLANSYCAEHPRSTTFDKASTIADELQKLLDRDPAPSFSPARYAKDMFAVRCPPFSGFKTRAGRLCDHLKARYSNREHAYIMSPAKAEKLRLLFERGADANSITGELREE